MNYATEVASITHDPEQVTPLDLVAAVEGAGYRASLPSALRSAGVPRDGEPGKNRCKDAAHCTVKGPWVTNR